jgi:hypothetical protein
MKIDKNIIYSILILSLAPHVAVAMDTSVQEKICIDIGFKPKTEKFGSCVIELISRNKNEQQVTAGDGTQDDLTCQSYGFKPATVNYSECRMKIDTAKKQIDSENARFNAEMAAYEEQRKKIEAQRRRQQSLKTMQMGLGLMSGDLRLEDIGRSSIGLPPKPRPTMQNQTIIMPGGRIVNCTTTGTFTSCN